MNRNFKKRDRELEERIAQDYQQMVKECDRSDLPDHPPLKRLILNLFPELPT